LSEDDGDDHAVEREVAPEHLNENGSDKDVLGTRLLLLATERFSGGLLAVGARSEATSRISLVIVL